MSKILINVDTTVQAIDSHVSRLLDGVRARSHLLTTPNGNYLSCMSMRNIHAYIEGGECLAWADSDSMPPGNTLAKTLCTLNMYA